MKGEGKGAERGREGEERRKEKERRKKVGGNGRKGDKSLYQNKKNLKGFEGTSRG